MTRTGQNTKNALIWSTIRLSTQRGTGEATIRAIASGVTEAAVYRHYPSKEDLCRKAYAKIVEQMAREK